MKFFIIKLKNFLLQFVLLLLTFCLILFSSSNILAAKTGLKLWAISVVPTLFPFFVATELLIKTNLPYFLGSIFNIFMKPLFNIRGEGSFALIMGIISGYPVGAKIACNFRKNNILSKTECERLLSFTNNSGPLFIIGTVGINMFGSSTIGILLLITHILACFTVGFLFRFWKHGNAESTSSVVFNDKKNQSKNQLSLSNLGEALSSSITNATSTILMIGGFIVIFSVIVSILQSSSILYVISNIFVPIFDVLHIPSSFIAPFLTGLLEITNGISLISSIPIKSISINIILTSFLLGIGGISVFLQVLSIVSKTDLSIKPYVIGKILHGFFAAFYTFLFMQIFPFFNFNI